jgi:hypothetical protein
MMSKILSVKIVTRSVLIHAEDTVYAFHLTQ